MTSDVLVLFKNILFLLFILLSDITRSIIVFYQLFIKVLEEEIQMGLNPFVSRSVIASHYHHTKLLDIHPQPNRNVPFILSQDLFAPLGYNRGCNFSNSSLHRHSYYKVNVKKWKKKN